MNKSVILMAVALLLSIMNTGTVLAEAQPEEPFISELQILGRIEDIGTHFEINNSEYLNVTLDSSDAIKLVLESAPEMVIMQVEADSGASSTLINLGGFLPSTTYHKYEDDYHNHTAFTTDASGNYTYTQDISKPHLIFIQPVPSTKFIRDDATGGDCISIGIWDAETKTCTLTMDVYEVIQIDSNGITLDGNGYTVKGSRPGSYWPGIAVFVYGKTGVTVKNLNAKSAWAGFYLYQSSGNTLINNTASSSNGFYLYESSGNKLIDNRALNNNYGGIFLEESDSNTLINNIAYSGTYASTGIKLIYSNNNVLINNTVSDNAAGGIRIYSSNYNNLIGNIATNNRYGGISVERSVGNILNNNTMSGNMYNFVVEGKADYHFDNDIDKSNTVDGKPIYYVKNAINQIYDASTNAGTFYCINCSNVTIKGLNLTKNGAGIVLWRTQNSIVESNNISNNRYGIELYHSNNNKVYNNNFVYNGWWYRSNYYPQQAYAEGGSNNIFNLSAPVGGNYWNNYDEPVEGCNDADSNGFCDAPYIFNGGQDNLPWVLQSGWPSDNTPPTTTIALIGTQGNNGWYISDVQVTLSATDNEGGSGVKNTEYSFYGTNWNLYTVTLTITNEGETTVHYRSTDNADNVELTNNQTIKIDKTPPTITGAPIILPNINGWYNSDVTVHFTASDSVSGIDTATPDTTIATEGGEQSVTGTAIDIAGNSNSTTVSGINIDKTPPMVTINTPANRSAYILNQALMADWSATDSLSGIASLTGTLPNGAVIDTSIVGTKTFTVAATDNADNAATQIAFYTITYNFLGILPPVRADGSSIFKLGRTVPVKFRITDANGNYVSTATANLTCQKITDEVLGTVEEAVSTSATNQGNIFRYDSIDNLYIFNLGTEGMTTGTYQLSINLDDGTSHIVRISLR